MSLGFESDCRPSIKPAREERKIATIRDDFSLLPGLSPRMGTDRLRNSDVGSLGGTTFEPICRHKDLLSRVFPLFEKLPSAFKQSIILLKIGFVSF